MAGPYVPGEPGTEGSTTEQLIESQRQFVTNPETVPVQQLNRMTDEEKQAFYSFAPAFGVTPSTFAEAIQRRVLPSVAGQGRPATLGFLR